MRSLAPLCGSLAAAAALALAPGTATAAELPILGGGSGIVIANTTECTLTTIGHDAAGRLVGLTAGHCGEPGQSVVSETDPNAGVLGRIATSNRDLDYAVIEFDPRRVAASDRVGSVSITGVGAPAQFPATVCKKGRTTGTNCGIVWGDVFARGTETWTQICVLPGDSGAPVVAGSTLVGMVNAYLAVGCFGPEVGTTWAAIQADLDANQGIGAGFRPAQGATHGVPPAGGS
ncbi:S1 family peptidase [Nocardia sp. CDC159]|uniref:S1 family peptidase n=1 Tax=Nocardia pulmonis TaxID=2951408 RepID=A0A9X2EH23_9NOCA|nr:MULTISPECIES: S1 family peptidase [Nocardia]MCM6778078.1 S1 family peptidase [Nocardia pulmonis]MCM6790967.1 S1 family peptidase [Nocardia sp. CDC159]